MNLDCQIDHFVRSIISYHKNPCAGSDLELQRSAIYLKLALREYEKDLVMRVTDNVLKTFFATVNVEEAVWKIDSLNNAIKRLSE